MTDPSGLYVKPAYSSAEKGTEKEDEDPTASFFKNSSEQRDDESLAESESRFLSPTFEASILPYEEEIIDYISSFLVHPAQTQETSLPLQASSVASTNHPEIVQFPSGRNDNGRKSGHPNEPHPLLDFPLLYHLFQSYPSMISLLERFYNLHWKIAYPLQRRVPFMLHVTWADLLLLVPYILGTVAAILYTAVFPSVKITGRIARYGLIAAFVLAQRNSLFTFIVGIPIDRALFYHKLAGRFAGLAGILHTATFFLDPFYSKFHRNDGLGGAFTGTVNRSGSFILIFVVGIVLSSLPTVRRRMFEAFFYLHYIFVFGVVVSAFFHSGIVIPVLAWLLWGVDLLLRKLIMSRVQNPRTANLRVISDSVVELSFRKPSDFAYNPGQYVYITIPMISPLQSHPFSISSAPSQSRVTLHIRALGGWTSTLHDIATRESSVSMLMEGPYGNLSVDLLNDRRYRSVMLVSGGIGVTPMQSISDQLLYEHQQKTRRLNNLMFIWIERDPVLIKNTSFREKSTVGASRIERPQNTLADTLLGMFPQSTISDKELANQVSFALGSGIQRGEDACSPAATDGQKSLSEILDMRIYLTGKDHPFVPGFARGGRPDIRELFLKMRQKAVSNGDKRVAVCVSAPRRLRELVQKACVLFSDEQVEFDFHTEVIEN